VASAKTGLTAGSDGAEFGNQPISVASAVFMITKTFTPVCGVKVFIKPESSSEEGFRFARAIE
jgi:hypothetical protein